MAVNLHDDLGKNEFVVQRSKVNILTAHNERKLQRVRQLFAVDVSITSKGDESGEWVTVKGPEEIREKATVSCPRSEPVLSADSTAVADQQTSLRNCVRFASAANVVQSCRLLYAWL